MKNILLILLLIVLCNSVTAQQTTKVPGMHLNKDEYLENQGVNVMLAHDFYPEGHQGGVGVIQNGMRVATNGDIRLEPTPGQWAAIPKVGKRLVDTKSEEISVQMEFPDSSINRKGFNPIIYPDLHFKYRIRVEPVGESFRIIVDLESPLPDAWIGKVGFNFELYPGILFGKSYAMDQVTGIFPRQPNDQIRIDSEQNFQTDPMARGHVLTIAPESDLQRMSIINENGDGLQLLDGRGRHNNGWFVVRSLVAKGATQHAISWLVTPHAIPGWRSDPVVQVSQVGYHPMQQKIAVIELDKHDSARKDASLVRIGANGEFKTVLQSRPKDWGNFLRYHYLQFDFTPVKDPGMYLVRYGKYQSGIFQISKDVYKKNVWQPTLEYFLPVQMCHMRVNDKYRVWHGLCHMDDARMAPIDSNHFDGYIQGHTTLTSYHSGETVPGLNQGAWHDAGDFDLRVESQAETVMGLSFAYEQFKIQYDNTSVNQHTHIVEIQEPDGKPDILEQIEHGLLSIVGGYRSMGRFYRGIIEPTLRQYTILGDPVNITDDISGNADDRWVFTEDNPGRSLQTAAALAAASRVMKGFNDTLCDQSLQIAETVWKDTQEKNPIDRVALAVELLKTTGNKMYADFLTGHVDLITGHIAQTGWLIGPVIPLIHDELFKKQVTDSVRTYYNRIREEGLKTPYGVPYRPNIWGAGWDIQRFGYRQYFLHLSFPEIFPKSYMLNALNFILGCHPGTNTASFVSGVGANSMTTAYGFNRADWSYIPGGITSGTALIRPDFPELLNWPYLWQQGEYVLGGGTSDYLFLVLAADKLLSINY
jgi:endoglucanase